MCRTCWVEGHFGASGPCLGMHLEACVMSDLVCMLELTEYVAACKSAGQVCHLALITDMRLHCVLTSPSVCRGFSVLLLLLLLLLLQLHVNLLEFYLSMSSSSWPLHHDGAGRDPDEVLWSEGFYQDIITHGSGVSITPLNHDIPQACMLLYTSCQESSQCSKSAVESTMNLHRLSSHT